MTDGDIKNKFTKDDCIIYIIKLKSNEKIVIKLEYQINELENTFSYDDLIKAIKPLRMNENIDELYDNLIDIFKNNDYIIKNEEDKSEIFLKLFNNKGIKEDYHIILRKVESKENIQNLIIKEIRRLENDNKILKEENKKLNNQIKAINDSLEKIKTAIDFDTLMKNKINFKSLLPSDIITNPDEFNFVIQEIEKKRSRKIKKFFPLYKASENRGLGREFHIKCDGKEPTIVIILTENGYKLGGYTELAWPGGYVDEKAFCFSINLKKIYNVAQGKIAIYSPKDLTNGPIFGAPGSGFSNFIQISEDIYQESYHYPFGSKNSPYSGISYDYEVCGGKKSVSILEYEVFQIIFEE